MLHNFQQVKARIEAATSSNQSVQLLAVSKTKPHEALRELASYGQNDFGENYVQEALQKQQLLNDLDLVWHFIGAIQSNKTREIAENFDWVHTVDRLKIATRLSEQRLETQLPLNVLIQINIDNETSKSGIDRSGLFELADAIINLPKVRLRGLMCIPAIQSTSELQLQSFSKMNDLFNAIKQRYPKENIDTLSMGMSGDLDMAIAAGSTMVRVGTDLFGHR